MALQTLRSMAGGGIYDQVGGGFSRYSVDARWTVPHFEKMLYDNALLARAYLHGFQASGDALLRRTAEETLDWALREMRAPEGGFYSALDADSEGVEGNFYVWTRRRAARGARATTPTRRSPGSARPSAATSRAPTSSSRAGPSRRRSSASGSARRLLAVRARRVRPGLDDKRLAAWNALMIAALADAGAVLGRDDYLDAARGAAAFVLEQHARRPTGGCCAPSTRASAKLGAYLEDHAFLLEALLVLYEATFEERWFTEARALADTIVARFADPERGGFFSTADDHEALIARRKDLEDTPIPAGGSAAAFGLLRLAALTGERRLRGAGGRRARAPARDRVAPPGRVRAPAAGARPLPRPARARSRWPATRPASRRWRRRARGAPARTSCSRAAGPATTAVRAHGAAHAGRRPRRRPTCASASPASARSPAPDELRALLEA